MLPVSIAVALQNEYANRTPGGTDKQSVINAAGKFALQYYMKQQGGGMGGMASMMGGMGGGSSGGGGGASGLMSLASKFLK